MPTNDLQTISPFLREFGPILCVLFIVLFFLLSLVSYIVIQQARKISQIENTLTLLQNTHAGCARDIEAIAENLAMQEGVLKAVYDRIRDIFDYFMRRGGNDGSAAQGAQGGNRPPQGG